LAVALLGGEAGLEVWVLGSDAGFFFSVRLFGVLVLFESRRLGEDEWSCSVVKRSSVSARGSRREE
jgi:hypothetical protein